MALRHKVALDRQRGKRLLLPRCPPLRHVERYVSQDIDFDEGRLSKQPGYQRRPRWDPAEGHWAEQVRERESAQKKGF